MTDDLFPLPEQTDPLAVARAAHTAARDAYVRGNLGYDADGQLRADMARTFDEMRRIERGRYEAARKSASAPEPA